MTTENLLTEWLETYQKEHIKARTYSRYQGLISMHIVPTLGERSISEVGRREIQEFLTQQKKDGNGNLVIVRYIVPQVAIAITTILYLITTTSLQRLRM